MLNQSVKDDIQQCYSNLKTQLAHFAPRRSQNYLIAQLAKTLAGEYNHARRIMVAEAGTGTGKSMGYLIGALPYALANKKQVVISTATVALQEQLLAKDLPLFRRISPTPFNFVIAKGRQRYCCRHKLANEINAYHPSLLETTSAVDAQRQQLEPLHHALAAGEWDGDRDSWPTPINDELWLKIVSDKHSCHLGLSAHLQCPFAKAREQLGKADVIIANHSLLMADLALGGGVILPEPEDCVYLIDEAHHLSTVARDFSAANASLLGSITWLEHLKLHSDNLARLADLKNSQRFLDKLHEQITQILPDLKAVLQLVNQLNFNQDGVFRFADGILPPELVDKACALHLSAKQLHQCQAKLHDLLTERLKEGGITSKEAEPVLIESGNFLQRLENFERVWAQMAQDNSQKKVPLARWIRKAQPNEREHDKWVHVSPLDVSFELELQLWSKAAGVGLFSATLRALNSFDYFCHQVGLKQNDGTQFLALASPFDYANQAQLILPKLDVDPSDEAFTDTLPALLTRYLEGQQASLVLFCSYWQMNQVAEKLRPIFKQKGWQLQVQGETARNIQLTQHQGYCQAGLPSVLFGTSSFAEGLDLPGELLTNLIITKIPFSVPTSPIEEAHAEYIKRGGGNPFLQITIPEASKKLVQAVGRLLRQEQDRGRVVLLDKRLVSKRYGQSLLACLPPFQQIIERD